MITASLIAYYCERIVRSKQFFNRKPNHTFCISTLYKCFTNTNVEILFLLQDLSVADASVSASVAGLAGQGHNANSHNASPSGPSPTPTRPPYSVSIGPGQIPPLIQSGMSPTRGAQPVGLPINMNVPPPSMVPQPRTILHHENSGPNAVAMKNQMHPEQAPGQALTPMATSHSVPTNLQQFMQNLPSVSQPPPQVHGQRPPPPQNQFVQSGPSPTSQLNAMLRIGQPMGADFQKSQGMPAQQGMSPGKQGNIAAAFVRPPPPPTQIAGQQPMGQGQHGQNVQVNSTPYLQQQNMPPASHPLFPSQTQLQQQQQANLQLQQGKQIQQHALHQGLQAQQILPMQQNIGNPKPRSMFQHPPPGVMPNPPGTMPMGGMPARPPLVSSRSAGNIPTVAETLFGDSKESNPLASIFSQQSQHIGNLFFFLHFYYQNP